MLYRLLNKISRKIHEKPRKLKKGLDWFTFAGLNLLSTLTELSGLVLIQWPEKDKKFSW